MRKLILLLLVSLTIFLRFHNLEQKVTYEWDQERDMHEVSSMLSSHKLALVGPIVKGEAGGFYLGPFYYYLLAPIVALTHGNPLSLAIISIGTDILVVVFLFSLLSKITTQTIATITSLVWACSPLIISMSMVPWNVSFIPLWSIGFLWSWYKLNESRKWQYLAFLIFLASLTTSIHLSLWPLAGLGALLTLKFWRGRSLRELIYIFVSGLIPLIPMAAYDLTHQFDNLRRFIFFIRHGSHGAISLVETLQIVFTKFGYTIGRLLTGEPLTALGIGVMIVASIYTIFVWSKNTLARISLMTILFLLASLIYYRNPDFAEYYFIGSFIPLLFILSYMLQSVLNKRGIILSLGVLLVIASLYLNLGLKTRAQSGSPYSISVKQAVVSEIKSLGYPVEVRYTLPRERNTAFEYLLKKNNVSSDSSAARKAYIYEASNMEVISPSEARSIILEKPIQGFKLVVFSN